MGAGARAAAGATGALPEALRLEAEALRAALRDFAGAAAAGGGGGGGRARAAWALEELLCLGSDGRAPPQGARARPGSPTGRTERAEAALREFDLLWAEERHVAALRELLALERMEGRPALPVAQADGGGEGVGTSAIYPWLQGKFAAVHARAVEFCRARLVDSIGDQERRSFRQPVCPEVPLTEWVQFLWELEGLPALFTSLVGCVVQARSEEKQGRQGQLSHRLEMASRHVRWLSRSLQDLPAPMPRELFLSAIGDDGFRAGVQDDLILLLDMMDHAEFLPRLLAAVKRLQDFCHLVMYYFVKSHVSHQELLALPGAPLGTGSGSVAAMSAPGGGLGFGPIFAPASRELTLAVSLFFQDMTSGLDMAAVLQEGRVGVSASHSAHFTGLGEARSMQVLAKLDNVWGFYRQIEAFTWLPASEHLLDCCERVRAFLGKVFAHVVDNRKLSTSSGLLVLQSLKALRDFLRKRYKQDLTDASGVNQASPNQMYRLLQNTEMDVSDFIERLKYFQIELFSITALANLHGLMWEGTRAPEGGLSPGLEQWHLSVRTLLQETSSIGCPGTVQVLVGHFLVESLHLLKEYYVDLIPSPQWRQRYRTDVTYVAATACKFLGTRLRRTLSQSSIHTLEKAEVGLPFSLSASASGDVEKMLADLAVRANLATCETRSLCDIAGRFHAQDADSKKTPALLPLTARLPYCQPYILAVPSAENGYGLKWNVGSWWESCQHLFDEDIIETVWDHMTSVMEAEASPADASAAAFRRMKVAGLRVHDSPQEEAEARELKQLLDGLHLSHP